MVPYSKRLEAVIAAKSASTKSKAKTVNAYVIFLVFLYIVVRISSKLFLF